MLLVGLTGGIACGKTTVSNLFSRCGAPVIDADVLSRELVLPGSEGLSEIVAAFGDKVLAVDGTLNRDAMRKLIFSDREAKRRLESILHPRIRERMSTIEEQLRDQNTPYCIEVIPLLFESGQQDKFDRILVIDCDEETQVSRIVLRDKCAPADARKIIKAQISRGERTNRADNTIVNDTDLQQLEKQVVQLHRFYTQQSQANR